MTVLARIEKPGLQTTVQDGGRPGRRHLGVPLSGATDALSLALANAALGNPLGAAALECALTGPTIAFEADCAFALSGADMNAELNGERVGLYQRVNARAGDALTMTSARAGARAYIAFPGGVMGDDFLGGVSTYLPGGLGGVEGRALRAGDFVKCAELAAMTERDIPASVRPMLAHDFVLRATRGPDAPLFADGDVDRFFAAGLTADKRADRMGVRLNGFTLTASMTGTMNSSPVFPGTVQCPPDGAPFLLLADAQTTGGYPRIAQVIAADISVAAQIRPGDRVWFRNVSPEDALDISRCKQELIGTVLPGFCFY